MDPQERFEELGKESNALCQGSPIQEQIRVRKREAGRKDGGPGKNQEEGTSRPTLSVLKYERRPTGRLSFLPTLSRPEQFGD